MLNWFRVLPLLLLLPVSTVLAKLPLESIQLPPGFNIEIYAENIPGARQMALADNGVLFVGSRPEGKVYAVIPGKNNNTVTTFVQNLNSPNGVAFHQGNLYIAEINQISRITDVVNKLNTSPKPEIINDSYPSHPHHGWKYIAFGPDDKLYVPVGAPCNVCLEEDPRFSSITRIDAEGNNFEIIAEGIRNTVGFDWHPKTKELWFSNNGRDMLGDDIPPDTFNRISKPGLHFGFPFCHTLGIVDPNFGVHDFTGQGCAPKTVYFEAEKYTNIPRVITDATVKLAPHTAALGVNFYRGNTFPEAYHHQAFIAEHGSWNRSKRIGYRITLVTIDGSNASNPTTFASGWLDEKTQNIWGRPVDIITMPDGSILVSDDYAHVIYRIYYDGNHEEKPESGGS